MLMLCRYTWYTVMVSCLFLISVDSFWLIS